MASLKFAIVMVVCMAMVGAPMVNAAISCGQVNSALAPCLPFITRGGAPPPPCCNGVRGLVGAAKTTADRQAACNCLKAAAGALRGFNQANAAALPGRCGVNIPYKISTSTNCATIRF